MSLSICGGGYGRYKNSGRAGKLKLCLIDGNRTMKKNKYLLIGFASCALMAVVLILCLQNNRYKTQLQQQQFQIFLQAALIDSMKNSQVNLISNLLEIIDHELKGNPNRTLKDETISRIAVSCYSFKPYHYLEGDSLSLKKLSPERGHLLLMLTTLEIDTSSLRKIFFQSSFENADLREADLNNSYLSGANLRGSDLRDAKLNNAILRGVNLSYANLWGADLTNAKLDSAILKRADLSWSVVNGAHFHKADLYETDMISAQIRRADLSKAILQWTNFRGAFLNEANLDSADLFRANLIRANLEKSILKNTNLTLANITEANLKEVDLTGAVLTDLIVSEYNWPTLIIEWHVKGAEEIQKSYKIITESSEESRYQLKKNEDIKK
jgi:uncharacterized protein YjbI with pentapeptide repeats